MPHTLGSAVSPIAVVGIQTPIAHSQCTHFKPPRMTRQVNGQRVNFRGYEVFLSQFHSHIQDMRNVVIRSYLCECIPVCQHPQRLMSVLEYRFPKKSHLSAGQDLEIILNDFAVHRQKMHQVVSQIYQFEDYRSQSSVELEGIVSMLNQPYSADSPHVNRGVLMMDVIYEAAEFIGVCILRP